MASDAVREGDGGASGGTGVRLQRVLARAGIAARRTCERLIAEGRVAVNGVVVRRLPVFVDPARDRVTVNGRPVGRSSERARLVYVMLNKPRRVLAALGDEPGSGRTTVADLVRHPSGERLFPVGLLDYDAEGLVLLTNDGALAHRLTHPRYGVARTYVAVVRGAMTDEEVSRLERGALKASRKARRAAGGLHASRVSVRILARDAARTSLELTLAEGRNRHMGPVLAGAGRHIRRLERVGLGPLRLTGVARGRWRELTREEVRQLRKAAPEGRGGESVPSLPPKKQGEAPDGAWQRTRSGLRSKRRDGRGAMTRRPEQTPLVNG